MVNIGVDAFLPASQIDVIPPRNLDEYMGKTFKFIVVKINQERHIIVLSAARADRAGTRRQAPHAAAPSTCRSARFVPAGSRTSRTSAHSSISMAWTELLHITDTVSWGSRINHPSELLKVGETIEVMILEVDREKERVPLGLKQRGHRNPWDNVEVKYPVGSEGAWQSCQRGGSRRFRAVGGRSVEGMVHVSELSWTKRVARASDGLKVGEEIDALVLEIKREEQKISLGIRQLLEANPWSQVPKKYPPGTKITGDIRNLTNFGAFVEIEEGIDGMVHVSDMSWSRKVTRITAELLKKGQTVDAVVLEVDSANQRVSLGMKQLEEDLYGGRSSSATRWAISCRAKSSKLASFGAFAIELPDKLEGLVHISQISEDHIDKDQERPQGRRRCQRACDQGGCSRAAHRPEHQGCELQRRPTRKPRKSSTRLRSSPGEAIVDLEHAFEQAEEERNQ